VPQRSYARRQRVAIIFDSAVEEPEERRRFLVGQVELHQARVSNTVSTPASAAITAASSAMRINLVIPGSHQ
jgi:hypothetical protein